MQEKSKILYIDCFAGVSGDMLLAALVDLGANATWIEEELNKLSIVAQEGRISLQFDSVMKKGARALSFSLKEPIPHFHNHNYVAICNLITQANLPEITTKNALRIFEIIATAEAKIHNIPVEKVHFHEIAAIDSIVDIIGATLAFENLGIQECITGIVKVGYGNVSCQHGIYPVPALATLEILKGVPIESGDYPFEMTTPTGASIIANYTKRFSYGMPLMLPEAVGYGAGTRDLPNHPNILRLILGKPSAS